MKNKYEKKTFIEMCPIRNVIARIGNKWALLIIIILHENHCLRFNKLRELIPDISPQILSSTLKILEADNLITRKAYNEIPPRVEYALTSMGESLVPIINDLTEWAKQNMGSIIQHRNNVNQ